MGNRMSRKALDTAPDDLPPAYPSADVDETTTRIVEDIKERMSHVGHEYLGRTVFAAYALLLMSNVVKRPKDLPNVYEQEALVRLVTFQFDGLGHAQYVMTTPTQGYWVGKQETTVLHGA